MGPKKNISTRQISMSLDDAIETDEWHCAVGMVVEKKQSDYGVLNQFPMAAFHGLRHEIKSVNYDLDIIRIIKQFINGEIEYRYSGLLMYSGVFEEAADIIKKQEKLSVPLLVQIVKALILLLKQEEIERVERKRTNPNDPIKAMTDRPAVLHGTNGKANKGVDKKPDKKDDKSLKLKPPSVGKEDTKLLKRGEGSKESEWIDDAPKNSYYQLYIVLTGFYDPEFPLELIKAHVPLTTIICLDSPSVDPSIGNSNIQHFWEEFLKIIWNPLNTLYFKDTIFQVYAPKDVPTDLKDLQKFIYTELSFLMYDLSDFKRQHSNYLDNLKLWNVSEGKEKIRHEQIYQEELDSLPCECVTIAVVLQYILDVLCGDDDIRDEGVQDINYASLESEAPSIYTRKTNLSSLTTLSNSPNLSRLFMRDIRSPIYQKFKSLDVRYDLVDEQSFYEHLHDKSISGSSDDLSLNMSIKRQRLYAENLEDALRGGVKQNFITSCWKTQEPPCKDCNYKEVKFPPAIMDYSLYLLWMQKVVCKETENKEMIKSNSVQDSYGQRYSLTEFARMGISQLKGYFSAPELKIISPDALKSTSKIKSQPFVSDLHIPEKYLNEEMKVYEDIRTFLGEDIFSDSNGFEFVEEFSKKEIEELMEEIVLDYNCIDCSHSELTDSVFLVCHKRKGDEGVQRETYNVSLKTAVGLRDFYDYVIDDEKNWINENEECYRKISGKSTSVSRPVMEFRNFTDADFISENSLKSQKFLEDSLKSMTEINDETPEIEEVEAVQCEVRKTFSGYDVSPMAVQYSGLNAFFSAADNCSVETELQERLYGKQEFKIKIRQGGHILYLYSYVCPKPHISDQYTCHILHRSGMIIAFTRRTIEMFEEIEELVPLAPVKSKSRKLSQEISQVVIKRIPISLKDDNFFYDMKLSLPSGLTVEIVKNIVEPCYVKQSYIVHPDCYSKSVQSERSRLYLPNGDLVKMLTDNTIQILNGNAMIINSLLEPDIGASYDKTMPNGNFFRVIDKDFDSVKRFPTFENIDMETRVSYFRRSDGTNYALYPDGTFCVYFKDGTKISTSFDDNYEVECRDGRDENYGESYGEEYSTDENSIQPENFVLVHVKRIFEHPDYATVIYDTATNEFTIKLPFDSEIKTATNGCYFVNLDEFTNFHINPDNIFMNRRKMETFVETTVNLRVFESEDKKYCETIDSTGRTFTVESTGNCYVNDPNKSDFEADIKDECETKRKLSKENRYLIIRRDKSGFELVHKENAFKILSNLKEDTILFSQNLPGQENKRFFVLLDQYVKRKKWEVKSIILDFEYPPNNSRKKITSTYGVPPSWMHPFYEKKTKITIPERLTARVLIELMKTGFQKIYSPKYKDCQIEDFSNKEIKFENGFKSVQKTMRKIAADDQDLLRDLYVSAVSSEIEIANSFRPIDPEKLNHYLKMSEYYNQMKDFYKNSIKNHVILNYFSYPTGLSWLVLQDLIDSIEEKSHVESTEVAAAAEELTKPIVDVVSSEIVYNLEFAPEKYFSELSYRSEVSSASAPAVLQKFKGLVCEGKDFYASKSEPTIKYQGFMAEKEVIEKKESIFSKRGSEDLRKGPSNSCVFTEQDLKLLSQQEE